MIVSEKKAWLDFYDKKQIKFPVEWSIKCKYKKLFDLQLLLLDKYQHLKLLVMRYDLFNVIGNDTFSLIKITIYASHRCHREDIFCDRSLNSNQRHIETLCTLFRVTSTSDLITRWLLMRMILLKDFYRFSSLGPAVTLEELQAEL
ncbi:unnamed protein product [Schistosoma rodhaini]|uniref:Uncharacterized protein n=1 Tax=Schistosoma rodhaini TaxID=6188 RepID=A0AA85EU67_9TREM|nr:unnamed protein product [Schistosoma rodhaini]